MSNDKFVWGQGREPSADIIKKYETVQTQPVITGMSCTVLESEHPSNTNECTQNNTHNQSESK